MATFTPRESQILEMLRENVSNEQIAKRLNIATNTVKTHVHNIYGKLGMNDKKQRPSVQPPRVRKLLLPPERLETIHQ